MAAPAKVEAPAVAAAPTETTMMMMMIIEITPLQVPAMLQHLAEAMADWYCCSLVADAAVQADMSAAMPHIHPPVQKTLIQPQICYCVLKGDEMERKLYQYFH